MFSDKLQNIIDKKKEANDAFSDEVIGKGGIAGSERSEFTPGQTTEFYMGKPLEYWMGGVIEDTSSLKNAEVRLDELVRRKAQYEQIRVEMRALAKGAGGNMAAWNINNLLSQVNGHIEAIILLQQNAIKCLENGGDTFTFKDQHGREFKDIPDFSNIDTHEILFDTETILTTEAPKYIPILDLERLNRKQFAMDTIELGSDHFLLCIDHYVSPYEHVGQLSKPNPDRHNHLVILNLEQLVLTSDYYVTKQKAKYIDEAEKVNEKQLAHWRGLSFERQKYYIDTLKYYHLTGKEKKQFSQDAFNKMSVQEKIDAFPRVKMYPVKRVKLSDSSFQKDGERTMPTSLHHMYEDFLDKTAVLRFEMNEKGRRTLYGNKKIFEYWYYLKDALKWKLVDIREQRKEIAESRQAGMETSYGMSNTSDALLEEHGLYVKRQNGDAITSEFVEQINESYISIQQMFGGLRMFTAQQPLVISHAANTYMYAMRALGVYISSFNAIGVTAKRGPFQFNDTFAHELAHMIDNRIGEKRGRRYLSDDRNSGAALIGYTFRKLMNTESDSDYLNSTKECFARAMQMYYAIETRGQDAGGVYDVSPPNEEKPYILSDAFVSQQAYTEVIKPAIQQFFKAYSDYFLPVEAKRQKASPINPMLLLARARAQRVRVLALN